MAALGDLAYLAALTGIGGVRMARNGRFVFSRALLGRAVSFGAPAPGVPRAKARRRGTTVRLVDEEGRTLGVIPSNRIRAGRRGEVVVEVRGGSDGLTGLAGAGGSGDTSHPSFDEASNFVFEEYGEALKRLANA